MLVVAGFGAACSSDPSAMPAAAPPALSAAAGAPGPPAPLDPLAAYAIRLREGDDVVVPLVFDMGRGAAPAIERAAAEALVQHPRLRAVQSCFRAIQQELKMPLDGWFVGREDLRSYYESLLTPVTLTKYDDLWCPFREAVHVERWAGVLAPIMIAAGERFARGAPRTEAPQRQAPRLRTSGSRRQKRREH